MGNLRDRPTLTTTLPLTSAPKPPGGRAAILPGDKLVLSDQGGTAVFNLRTRRFGPEANGYELSFSLSRSGDRAEQSRFLP